MKFGFALVAILLYSVHCLPEGYMTFFISDSCPDGWEEFTTAKGRLIVSVTLANDSGITVNDPLKNAEDVKRNQNPLKSESLSN